MKRFLAALLAAAALSAPARASVLGDLGGAETLPVDGHLFGAYLVTSDHAVGLSSQLRLSFYPGVDFGFQNGIERVDFADGRRTLVRLGEDFRFMVLHAGATSAVDVALGAAIGLEAGDHYSLLALGPSVLASRRFAFGQSGVVVPYAGLAFQYASVDASTTHETDLSMPLRLGAEMRAIPGVNLVGELQLHIGDQIGDHVVFVVGANLPF